MTNLLDVERLSKRFGSVLANQEISLSVKPGEIVARDSAGKAESRVPCPPTGAVWRRQNR